MVAMAHPDLFAILIGLEPTVEKRKRFHRWGHIGAAKFGGALAAFDLAAELMHHDLLAITDAKDRYAEVKNFLRGTRAAVAGDAIWATGKDDRLGRHLVDHIHGHGLIGVDFAIDVQLTQAARNQLRHLRAKVDD